MADFPPATNPDEVLPSQESSVPGSLPDVSCLQRMLDAQRDQIHLQMDELQRVVVLQCRITGTNPLVQEMAAAVLGTRTGRRCGESLTPKAVKCLYNVFSIKDTITKKEAREISALCGATVTQVREFFSEQRSRVRKLVQLSHEEAGNYSVCFGVQPVKQKFLNSSEVQDHQFGFRQIENDERPYSSLLDGFHENTNKGINKSNTVETAENLIDIMRKESTFIGQIQLAQVILQAHQGPVLRWFMAKGGLQQIIKWLVQAAAEEQTSLIRILLKAVAHLPLGSALPRQMSSLLQIVNKLRFYRAQDVASRARLLLSRWSRFFRSTLNARILSTGSTGTFQAIQKRSRDATVLHLEGTTLKKKSKLYSLMDVSGPSSDMASSSSAPHPNNLQRLQLGNPSELELTSTKRRPANSLLQAERVKERRKVQLFEEARVRVRRRRNAEMVKTSGFDLAPRPLSADDIKKAKRRAHLLQSLSISRTQKSSNWQSDMSSSSEGLPYTSSIKQSFGDISYPDAVGEDNNFSAALAKKDDENSKSTSEDEKGPLLVVTASDQAKEYVSETISKLRVERVVLNENLKLEPSQHKAPETQSAASVGVLEAADRGMRGHKEKRKEGSQDIPIASKSMLLNVKENSKPIDGCHTAVHHKGFNTIQWTIPPRMVLDPRWRVASGEQSMESSNQSLRLKDEQEALYVSPECIPSNPQEPSERVSLFVDDTLVPEISIETMGEDSQDLDSPLQSPTIPDQARMGVEEADSKFAYPLDSTREFLSPELCQIWENTSSTPACTDTSTVKSNEVEDIRKPVLSLALNVVSPKLVNQSKLNSSLLCTAMESGEGEQLKDNSEVPNLTVIPASDVLEQTFHSLKVCSTSHMARETEQDTGIPFVKLEAEHTASAASHEASPALVDEVSSAVQASKSNSVSLKERHYEKKPLYAPSSDSALEQVEHNIKLGVKVVKGVLSEKKDDTAPVLAQTYASLMSESLPSLAGQMRPDSSTLEKDGGFSNQTLSSSLGVSASSHQESNLNYGTNGHTGQDALGFNLSELSKEDCLDMLKMVLRQLADNTAGSGADLELLSVFLKNPDLVYALTSSQASSSGKDFILAEISAANAIKGFSASNASDACKNLNDNQAEKLLGPSMLNPKHLTKNTSELREKVALGIQKSFPLLAELTHVRSVNSKSAVALQLRPPLPPMSPPYPPCMTIMDQATQPQHFQSKLSTSTHFLRQSSSQVPERNVYQISGEVASRDTARDWSQRGHGLLHAGSEESVGFVARSSMEISTPIIPSLDQCSMFPDLFQPRPGITAAGLIRSSNQPSLMGASSQLEREAANLVLPTIQTDLRGQPPTFMQGHHGHAYPPVSRVERQEVQVNGRNGSSFAAITNPGLEVNLNSRELGPSVGILRSTASVHSNERLQQSGVLQEMHARPVDKLPALMPDARGSQIVTQFMANPVPPKLTFVNPGPEHILRPPPLIHPSLPSAKPPLLPVCAPPFISVPLRPQGDIMIWQPSAAQSGHQSYLRPGWRGQ